MNYSKHLFYSTLILLLVTGLVGCGKKTDASKTDTQVIAKVNGDEISIHQLNYQMSRLGQINEEQAKAASEQMLARLVDQQLILQEAEEAKLDRDPKVLQAIENAKREIMVQAYIEQQIAGAEKPSEQEVTDFYNKHPELFEKRRIYKLQELAVAVGRDKLPEIEAAVKDAKGLADVAGWLKSKNYAFNASSNVRTAEQLPLELLPKLQQMKDGEIAIIPGDKSINILLLAASQEQPYSKEKATPIIEQYFLNQHKNEIAKQSLEKLRATAKIEYLGHFKDTAPVEASQPAPGQAAIKSDRTGDSKAEAGEDHINKGLKGL